MDKKEKEIEIAANVSSGAEKVERVEQEMKNSTPSKKVVKTKTTVKKGGNTTLGGATEKVSAKKKNTELKGSKAEKESAAAKARVEKALKKKELKEKRKAEREKRAKERAEKRKEMLAKWKAKHQEEAEKRRAKKEEKIRERAHAKANKKQERSKKQAQRKKNSGEKHRENRNKGYGGWIAAVVTLGVTTLALATTVTVGAIEMKNTKSAMLLGHREMMGELTGIIENVDSDLDRVRVSDSSVQQSRILTDLLVQARLAELDLEKLPIPAEADRNLTTFLNRTAKECERMLSKLRNGEKLSENDRKTLQRLYEANHSIRMELDRMNAETTDKDLKEYLKEGKGKIADGLRGIEEKTLAENRAMMEDALAKKAGAGMEGNEKSATEKPQPKVDPARAEELCLSYFSEYPIDGYQCVGETVSRSYSAYNVQGYETNGTLLFAEIDQQTGALLRFDYYEDCTAETFDLKNAEMLAENFLEKLGYDDMEVVRFRNNGTTTDFTFVYEDDGVAYYPDEVRVKVCRTRGLVTGLDATKYFNNHKDRKEPTSQLTLAEAYGKLYDGLEVESSRFAVVATMRGERTAYEFLCRYGEERYFVYLDANTGEEISIVNVRVVE